MTWSRPTCEINGMGGGYQGEGFKTVIPSMASAKVSFRLVFDQDPHTIRSAFRDFVRARLPADCGVEFHEHGAGRAIRFPIDAPAFAKAREALTAEWGSGGLHRRRRLDPGDPRAQGALGMDVVLAGFALEDDRIHSPNEKYELESFRTRAACGPGALTARCTRWRARPRRGRRAMTRSRARRRRHPMQRMLDVVERVGNRVPHPAMIFVILIGIVIVLSHILYMLGASVTYQVDQPGDAQGRDDDDRRRAAC